MRPEPFKGWTRPLRLASRLRKFLPELDGRRGRIKVVPGSDRWDVVELERHGSNVTLVVGNRKLIGEWGPFHYYRECLPVALYLFSRAKIPHAAVELHDGVSEPTDHMIFCANFDNALLIPDYEFFRTHAYAEQRTKLASQRHWRERSDSVVWRGSTTGVGLFPTQPDELLASGTLPRIRLCATLKSVAGTDVKISSLVGAPQHERVHALLEDQQLIGATVPADSWLDRKFAIDIDGNTNAWSNFFLRLLYGCCVLKVASPGHYRQWYYDRLRPFEHFVPIEADLGNMLERIEWCRSHPKECGEIAAAGQDVARAMTFETEMRLSVERIDARLMMM